jgi:hypothetical protein
MVDVGVHVNGYGHVGGVGCAEGSPEHFEMVRVGEVNVGVAEMEFEAASQVGVFGAAGDFGDGVIFERIDRAKGAEAFGISGYLVRGPIVFCPDVGVFAGHCVAVGIAELIGLGKNERMLDAGGIEHGDQIFGRNRMGE